MQQIGAVRVGRWVVVEVFIVAAVVVGVLAVGLVYVAGPSLLCDLFRLDREMLRVIKEGEFVEWWAGRSAKYFIIRSEVDFLLALFR